MNYEGSFQRTISMAAKVLHCFISSVILQAGSTGQLSTVTAFANFAGCIARIFTSLQEGGGAAMVRGYVLGKNPYLEDYVHAP